MLINDSAARQRLDSPMNLINKLRNSNGNNSRQSAMNLFGMGRPSAEKLEIKEIKPIEVKTEAKEEVKEIAIVPHFNPFAAKNALLPEAPKIEELIENSDSQMKLALAHDKALELLNNSVMMLSTKLEDVKADKLPGVITAASKVVDNIRRERNEAAKGGRDKEVHYHFYTPQQRKVSDYEVIDVIDVGANQEAASS